MARNQKNFQLYSYTDDNGDAWNKRGESGGAAAGVDGHSTFNAANRTWIDSSRQKVRRIIYTDATTGRTIDPIFYTSAAYDGVALGDTLAVQVEGLATTVDYTASKKVPEKQPSRRAARQLPDS
jgi:hypothetical protein